jgi:ferritin-like metal-binding protein YciE
MANLEKVKTAYNEMCYPYLEDPYEMPKQVEGFLEALESTFQDIRTLDEIQELLDSKEWDADRVEAVVDLVRATGRQIRDVN